MKFRLPPPILNPSHLWADDIIGGRSDLASKILEIVKDYSGSLVVGIEGEYGTGKTYFARRLEQLIKNQNGWVFYLNAWEMEFYQNPLTYICDVMHSFSENIVDPKAKKIDSRFDKNFWNTCCEDRISRRFSFYFWAGRDQRGFVCNRQSH